MDNNGLSFFAILFLAFLALSAALIVWMFISLVRLGDERRQLIVGKACTFSFMGMAGYLLLRTLVFLLGEGRELLHPLITLMVAAYLVAGSLAWYRHKRRILNCYVRNGSNYPTILNNWTTTHTLNNSTSLSN